MNRHVSPVRVATAIVLAAWAGLFWFLLVSGRSGLYLSSRTAWVVPVGAVALTLAAAGRAATVTAPRPEPLGRRSAAGLALIVVPVIVVLALPPAALGSYAASRRSALTAGIVPSEDLSSGTLTLVDVAAGMWSPEARKQLASRAGTQVTFVGFVTRRSGSAADEFVLTRFLVSCCVADALSVQVRVVGAPPGEFAQDQWVKVTGSLYPLGTEVLVEASSVEPVRRPAQPYLNV
jgi:uncharacterized repeat protein (TIGR03943 family)